MTTRRVMLFANTDWYLYNFRRALALELQRAGYEPLLVSPPGIYGPRLRDLGLHWEPLEMSRRSLNPFREAGLLWRLIRLVRLHRPAVVHGFTIKCAVYGALAARAAAVPARVSAVAGMGYVFSSPDLRARILRPLVRAAMRLTLGGKTARVILQNPDDLQLFEQAGLVDPSSVRLIPGSGVDCSRFTPSPRVPGAALSVLLPTRLLSDKGVHEFIDAARLLRHSHPSIRFLVAGDVDPGNPASIAEATIRDWVAQGLVEWYGHVEDMPRLLREVDVVALPSYREGLPKALIEAAACGLAIVATDVPGCREVVCDGVDGLLVAPRNARALADAIARLHSDPEARRKLGAAARSKAVARFSDQVVIAETLAVYDELLGPPETSGGEAARPVDPEPG